MLRQSFRHIFVKLYTGSVVSCGPQNPLLTSQPSSARSVLVFQGTTSVRTLESIYWHGEKLLRRNQNRVGGDGCDPQLEPIQDGVCRIGQWDPYITLDNSIDGGLPEAHDAFMAVADDAEHRGHCSVTGTTRLLIVPGYPFKVYVFLTKVIIIAPFFSSGST